MTALTKDRDTKRRDGIQAGRPVASAKKIYAGSLIARNSTGYAQPFTTAVGLVCLGVAEEYVDNSAGADGDLTVRVRHGVFQFANSAAADQITIADVGASCYGVDDQTVAKTSASSTRSVVGVIEDVDAGGVWVRV